MRESLFNKVAGLKVYNFIKNETSTQLSSREYCQIFKNILLYGTTPVAASNLTLDIFCREGFLRKSYLTLEIFVQNNL